MGAPWERRILSWLRPWLVARQGSRIPGFTHCLADGNPMSAQPQIVISETDLNRLEKLLDSMGDSSVPGIAELIEELERADVVPSQEIPPTVVTMNSTVRFRETVSSHEFRLTLVYPRDVAADGTTISILAPVGSALLGLSEGDEIEWPKPGGGTLRVRIEEVLYQPEREGEYHR